MSESVRVDAATEEARPAGRARVLIVDDSSVSRAYILNALSALPEAEVIAVGSGSEALRALQAGSVSLVLCDYEMPDMSGLQVLRFIRTRHNALELPVLMLTARDDADVKVRAFRAGASDYIMKQAEPEELLARVGTQIRLLDAHRRLIDARTRRAEGQKFEAIGHLSEALAHELNTPAQYIGDNLCFLSETFTSLQMLVNALLDRTTPLEAAELQRLLTEADCEYAFAEIPRCIEESQQGIAQMARVVAVMREFTQRGAEEATQQDLNDIVRGAVAVTRAQWHQVAELTLELDAALPAVLCVGVLIKQVVLYAIMNAVKALSPVDGIQRSRGRLQIQTRTLDAGWVAIDVIDSGHSLGSDDVTKVLDPVLGAAQLGETAQALAHIRGVIVDEHAGQLEVTSEPRAGTRLSMRLPPKRPATR